jgi:hypothetical protein
MAPASPGPSPAPAAPRPARRVPPPAVNAGPGGNNQDAELERLRRRYPRWRIWRGHAAGDLWAMPPPGQPALRGLISAGDLGELARRLAQAEAQHGP